MYQIEAVEASVAYAKSVVANITKRSHDSVLNTNTQWFIQYMFAML